MNNDPLLARDSLITLLKKLTLDSLLLKCLSVFLLFLMQVVLGRSLGRDGYGGFSFILALTNILVVFSTLGLPNATIRYISEYTENKILRPLKGILFISIPLIFFSSVIISALLAIFAKYKISEGFKHETLYYCALILPLIAVGQWRSKTARGFKNIRGSLIPEEVLLPLIFVLSIYLFSIKSIDFAIYSYSICYILVLLFGFYWLKSTIPNNIFKIKGEYKVKNWLKTSFPMIFGSLMQLILNKTDIVMLGILDGFSETGLYSAANRIALINTFFLRVIDTSIAPLISSAYYSGNIVSVKKLIKTGTKWSTIGSLPLFIFILIKPDLLLSLFGESFTEGNTILRILAVGQFINAITGPVGFALLMTGNQNTFSMIMFFSALFNMVGNAIVIPKYGAIGASIITMTSVILLNCGLLFATSRYVIPEK